MRGPKSSGGDAIAMRGMVVTLGEKRDAFMCYDMDLMRVSLAWKGDFLEFGNTLTQIAWPPPPQVKGEAVFAMKPLPGVWDGKGTFGDPRTNQQGPLPKSWAHYKGMYVNGREVVFKYSVGNMEVLELPGYAQSEGYDIFTRTLQFTRTARNLIINLLAVENPKVERKGTTLIVTDEKTKRKHLLTADGAVGVEWSTTNGLVALKVGKVTGNRPMRIAIATIKLEDNKNTEVLPKLPPTRFDIPNLIKGGAATWTETVKTKGVKGDDKGAYVVDTITEPSTNPYNVRNFFGGFDFFSDGRAAIGTFHGDVWVVSGITGNMEELTWKRYATGLFQPLGLKIVKDQVYVLGRDQITRLRDLNKDGEADFYENFNNDTVVTANYHEYCLDLHTDSKRNFYFAKGSPWEPEVVSPHQGCMIRVSKDGSKLEVIATGLRAPNGMTVGPRNEITVSDNQGHWMPSSKLNWIKQDGFYGMVPAAQKEMKFTRNGTNFIANPSIPQVRKDLGFKAWDKVAPMAEGYDHPVAWLPMNMDNSSGGQVWVTGNKFGPLKDKLLFMSYGKCTLFEVMLNDVDTTKQAAMVQLPLKFNSGIMRGRINPKDGQLYLCGLKGWQSSATRDGGFYRVRYTGKAVQLPVAFKVTTEGLAVTFTLPLDAKSANDAENYNVERWNYRWTGGYGSPEVSVSNPEQSKHDKLEVTGAKLQADGRTVVLAIKDMKPADQIKLKFNLDGADGSSVAQEIYATAGKLAEK
ncbi:MAG TPA: DUF6797 domain-containing protein [Verrucomicrobiae bacterium]